MNIFYLLILFYKFHNILWQLLSMCFLEEMTSAFDDFPFVVRDKIEEKVFKESSYWISAKVRILISL